MSGNHQQAIIDTVANFFIDDLGADESAVKSNQSLFKSGRLQSIDFLMTIAFMEDEFGISIEESLRDVDHLDTLDQFTSLVAERTDG